MSGIDTTSLKYVEIAASIFIHLAWKIMASQFSSYPLRQWFVQDVEPEPPVRPPLPHELQESHLNRDQGQGWIESPYEVWNIDII